MRKIWPILLLLFFISIRADAVVIVYSQQGGGGAASVVCDDCSDANLTFSWHAEDIDVTVGTPCGCSDGDTTATLVSGAVISSTQKSDGTNSLSFPTSLDYATFDNTSEDIINKDAGTIIFDIYLTARANFQRVFIYEVDSNNFIRCQTRNIDELDVIYSGDSTEIGAVTGAADLSLNTFYTVTAKWRTGVTDPSLSITVNGSTGTNNTDLTAIIGNSGTIEIGSKISGSTFGFIDKVLIYNNWQ